jgi:hypothetical protein
MGAFAETAIVVYRLLLANQGNKLLFSFSVSSKQMEVCHFCFLFAANEQMLPFSGSSNFHIYICCSFKKKSNGKRKPR